MSSLVLASTSASLSLLGISSRIRETKARSRLERSGSSGATSVCVGDLCVTLLKHCVVEVRPMADVRDVVVYSKGDVQWQQAVDACCNKDPRAQWPYSPLIVHMGIMANGRRCRGHYEWAKRFRESDAVDAMVRLMLKDPNATLPSYMKMIDSHFGDRRSVHVCVRRRAKVRTA